MLSIATDESVQMLQSGWTVRYWDLYDTIQWRSPDGVSGTDYCSESMDKPPAAAVIHARNRGDIIDRPRTYPGFERMVN